MISRAWAMPTKHTFLIPPIKKLIDKYITKNLVSVDPFAGDNSPATYTNDLNPDTKAMFHCDALIFTTAIQKAGLKTEAIIFDPPYSYRQVVEIYKGFGRAWTQEDQQQVGRWSKLKNELCKLLVNGGIVISFGWNTTGFGKNRGFYPIEYLIVNHGSAHNDTLCVVEKYQMPEGGKASPKLP